MSERTCTPCTACCDGWLSSRHIEMSPGRPCAHSRKGGCSIYHERPAVPCRSFECAWLANGSPLPDEMRPDRCGAIVMTGRQFENRDVIMATPTGWKIPDRTLQWLMAFSKSQGTPLIYIENLHRNGVYTHFKRSGYGPPAFIEAITDPAETLDIRII